MEAPITYPKLVKLLAPAFSPEGSNKRMQEEISYRFLLNYMKEVAGELSNMHACMSRLPLLYLDVTVNQNVTETLDLPINQL